MNKGFKIYALIWALAFVIFNALAFIFAIFSSGFAVIGYIFIVLMYALQLACGYFAFKEENLQKLFYNISLMKVCYGGLIIMSIVGFIAMAMPIEMIWIADVICLVTFAFCVISVLKASAAIEAVEAVDKKIKTQTLFIKSLTVDAQTLLAQAQSDVAKTECNKVLEAIRYSDPMSNDALASAESQITIKFQELKEAVAASEDDKIPELANQLIILVNDRNNKCKLLK